MILRFNFAVPDQQQSSDGCGLLSSGMKTRTFGGGHGLILVTFVFHWSAGL
jgi:hypothetical protein